MRMLAGKALRWKIVDEDAVSLDWVSLVEGAFPLPKSSHWDLAMQTRIQVRMGVDINPLRKIGKSCSMLVPEGKWRCRSFERMRFWHRLLLQ